MCEACKHTEEAVRKLTSDELFAADQFLNGSVLEIMKATAATQIRSIEMSLADAVAADFGRRSKRALRNTERIMRQQLKRGRITRSGIEAMMQPLDAALGSKFKIAQREKILTATVGIYNAWKRDIMKDFGVKPSFNVIDEMARAGIARNSKFWVGNFYNAMLSSQLRAIANDILITQGLPLDQAARRMMQAAGSTLGITDAQMPELSEQVRQIVPQGFNGTPQDYFRLVASSIQTTAKSFGTMSFMQDLGAEWYTLSNPMDKTTTPLCAFLNGKVYSVSSGVRVMDQYLNAQTPEESKEAMPWNSLSSALVTAGVESVAQFNVAGMTGDTLARSGNIALPPFHGNCRTIAEPTGISGAGAPRPRPSGPKPLRPRLQSKKPPLKVTKPSQRRQTKPTDPNKPLPETSNYKSQSRGYYEDFKPANSIEEAKERIGSILSDKKSVFMGGDINSTDENTRLKALNLVLYEAERFKKFYGLWTKKTQNQLGEIRFENQEDSNAYISGRDGNMKNAVMSLSSNRRTYTRTDNNNMYKLDSRKDGFMKGIKAREKQVVGRRIEKYVTAEYRYKSKKYDRFIDEIHAGAIVRHELGHAVQWIANRITNGKFNREVYKIYETNGGQKGSQNTLQSSISQYSGDTNSLEMFAEIFTVYTSPEFKVGSLDKFVGAGTEALIEKAIQLAKKPWKTNPIFQEKKTPGYLGEGWE